MNARTAANRKAGSREAGTLCPLCQSRVTTGEELSVCATCGTVHHRDCWETAGSCGSYECAPARRDVQTEAPALEISLAELSQAVPLAPRSPLLVQAQQRWVAPSPPEEPRLSRLAVASFLVAVAGIPLFGLLTGLVAIILGSMSLAAMSGTRLRGSGWAIGGVLLGVFDVVGWVLLLSLLLRGGGPNLGLDDFQPDVAALENLDPKINRAMRANVLIEAQHGWAALGAKAIGSGVILKIADGEALIITNRHVADAAYSDGSLVKDAARDVDAGNLSVKMIGQPIEKARVVWIAPGGVDLALIRARCGSKEVETAHWQKDKPLRVGDAVFAIGNPHNLGWTHTQGTVSQFRTQGQGASQIRVIQTQTAINPGNSGGGLYDGDGLLVGINTWTNDKRVSEGLSFSITFDSFLNLSPPELDAAPAAPQPPGEQP